MLKYLIKEDGYNEDGLFGNYGVGVKYKLADQLALKFDVRHLIETIMEIIIYYIL